MADNTPKWFKLFLRHKPMFDAAPAESVGIAMKALLAFFEDETEQVPDEAFAAMLYAALIPDAKEAIEEYRRICKRNYENGKRGGAPKGNQNARKQPKTSDWNPVGSTGLENNPNQPEEEVEVRSKKEEGRSKKREGEVEPEVKPKPETTLLRGRGAAEPPKGFAPPTLSELELFCSENGLNIDCKRFLYYYEARGWKLSGGMAMTDWKAAVRSWARMEHNPDRKNQNDKKGDSPEGNPYYVEGAIML